MRRWIAAVALLLATPAFGQPARAPTPYDRAIAAGYKALTLCSAMFNAGRTQAQAEALELTGIYPEYDAIVPTLSGSVVDHIDPAGTRWISVPFDAALMPRLARWREGEGCALAPIGDAGSGPAEEPRVRRRFAGSLDAAPWPIGDDVPAVQTPALLSAIVGRAFDGASFGNGRTTAVIVLRDGHILAEHYADGFGPHVSQRTWSVGKSITGTLIGMAVRDHLLDPEQPAPVPEWRDARSSIRLDDLLRMASGLHSASAGNRTDAIYFGGTSVTEEIASWPLEARPGTRFRYANNDILAAVRALRARIGNDARYHDFPRERLFAPLGMTRTVAEQDWQGNFILSSQVWSTARDLARLGLFWLNDGVWQGRRMLPEGWMRYMTTPSGPQPASGPGYGATMWLFGPAQGLPAGSYAAQGNRGQYVMVVPSRNLVVVRRGEDGTDMRFDIARFTADVMGALP
jgi:CubicO group peptidase (beta-lactamase class C family)